MNENLSTGVDSIDSVDFVVKAVRTFKKYIAARKEQIENYKIPEESKGASLQQEKAFIQGAKQEIEAMDTFIKKLGV